MKKNLFFLTGAFFSLAGILISCSELAIPETVTIKTPETHLEMSLGSLSTAKYFKPENFLKEMKSDDEKVKIYDYLDGETSKKMEFLMSYNIADIDIDLTETIDNLDITKKLGESADETFKFPSASTNFDLANDIDLQTKIIEELEKGINLTSIQAVELGREQTYTLPGITLNFNKPAFDTVKFRRGKMQFILGTPTNPISPDWSLKLGGQIKNPVTDALIAETEGGTLIECSNGGTIEFDLTEKQFPSTLKIVLSGSTNGGNGGRIHTYSCQIKFVDTDFDMITGITMSSEELGSAGKIDAGQTITIDSELKQKLISANILEGYLGLRADMPEGWSGFTCNMENVSITGGLDVSGDKFKDIVVPGSSYFLNKKVDLSGSALDTSKDIVLNGEISFSIYKGTIKFADSKTRINSVGDFTINKLGETVVDIDKVINQETLNKSLSSQLDENTSKVLKSMTFSSISLIGDSSESDLPETDLKIQATLKSNAFGIPEGVTSNNAVFGQDKMELKASWDPPHKYSLSKTDPSQNVIDAQLSVKLSGSNDEHPNYITFKELEPEKEYHFKIDVKFDFKWETTEIYTDGIEFNGSVDTKMNINDIFSKNLGNLTKEQLDHVGFRNFDNGEGAAIYIYASKPSLEALSKVPVTAIVKPKDGETVISKDGKEMLLVGNRNPETGVVTGENLSFVDLIDLETIAKPIEGGDPDVKRIVTPKRYLFPEGSYSKRIDNFGDILNTKPEQFKIDYMVNLGDGESESVILDYDTIESLRQSEEKKTSISIKMIVFLPMSLKIMTDKDGVGFEIPDLFKLSDDASIPDDLLNRESEKDFDEAKKYAKAIDSVDIVYQSSHSLGERTLMTVAGVSPSKTVFRKILNVNSVAEKNVKIMGDEVMDLLNSYPVKPAIALSVGNGIEYANTETYLTIPRQMNIAMKATLNIKEGVEIKVVGD